MIGRHVGESRTLRWSSGGDVLTEITEWFQGILKWEILPTILERHCSFYKDRGKKNLSQ